MGSKNDEAPVAATNEASNSPVISETTDMKSLAKACETFTIFKFGDSEIRVIDKNGNPWFVAKDVCDALELTNSRKSLITLDEDEKSDVTLSYTSSNGVVQQRDASIVSESGMYTLVLRCRDAVNKGTVPYKFRKWVTAEVLPSIRKNGQYSKTRRTTVEERTPLRDAVNMLVGKKGLRYDDAYNMVHQRFGIDSIDELDLDQIPQAVEYIHRVVLEGELVEKEKDVKCLANYNFPIESADPHDRRFGNDWVSAKVILDERNRAPELELIEALEKDGFDVSGIKVRIYAMYDVATRYLEMQSEFSHMKKTLSSMLDIAKYQSEERGINIIFSGTGRGGQIGGFKQRRLPR